MRKRKPATASKHARSPKIATKAQRAAQTIVRSPKVRLARLQQARLNRPPSLLTTQNGPLYTSGSPCNRESSDSPTRRFLTDDDG